MAVKVVHFTDVKEHWDPVTQMWDSPEFVYIGRGNSRYGLPASGFANPFKIDMENSREDVLKKYDDWLLDRPDLVRLAKRVLKDKTLVCWCRDHQHEKEPGHYCHGDILKELVEDETTL